MWSRRVAGEQCLSHPDGAQPHDEPGDGRIDWRGTLSAERASTSSLPTAGTYEDTYTPACIYCCHCSFSATPHLRPQYPTPIAIRALSIERIHYPCLAAS
jgi:hypothetical protein